MSLVEGVAGVFIQSKDPETLAGWYSQHLDMEFEEHPDGGSYYIVFRTRDLQTSEVRENPVFAIESAAGELAAADGRGFTLGLRVGNLDETLRRLTESGVSVEDRTLAWEGGKHGWMVDPDRNRVELYEEIPLPPDSLYRVD